MNLNFPGLLKAASCALLFSSCLTNAYAQLCTPSFTNGCTGGTGLNSIYFIGTSTSALTDLNTGCGGTNGYDNRTATSVTMNPGTAPNATFNTISGTANMQAWIDFNNDGAFSSSESIGGYNGVTSSGASTALTIPSAAATGTHILRFIVTSGDSYPNIVSCPTGSTYATGEAHDYTVFVGSPSPACASVTGLTAGSVTGTSANISWTAVTGSAGYEYVVNKTAGNPTSAGAASATTSKTVGSLLPNSTYYAHVRNKCNATSFSLWATKSFTTPSGCDTSLSVAITWASATSATASWAAVAGTTGYEYVINQSAANPSAAGIATATTSATLSALSTGATYYFHLRSKCGAATFSPWTTKVFKAGATAVAGIGGNGSSMIVLPNPTTGRLQINFISHPSGNAIIRITDVAGSLIKSIPVHAAQMQIDIQHAPSGIYFLRYTDDNASEILKIQKL